MLIGNFERDPIFHTGPMISHKSHFSAKSNVPAEILPAGETTDKGKALPKMFSKLLGFEFLLGISINSKKHFTLYPRNASCVDGFIRTKVDII